MADSIIGKISVGDGATFTPSVTNAGVLTWTNNKGLPNPDSVDIAQAVVDKKPGWGLPVGYEYFSINPNVPQGSLPLLGGEYNRSTYSDLWEWVQQQTGYLKTEAEWQALSTANNGNVPYYSDGDGSTTFRVPSLQCWVRGANGSVSTVGSYLAAGLPNITGQAYSLLTGGAFENSGALSYTNVAESSTASGGKYASWGKILFDASRSSSIYGNSSTVQPESIVGMWLVKAYGTIVDTGSIDEQQYIDDRIAAEVTRSDGKYLPLAGGTMSGAIVWSGTNVNAIKRDNGNNGVCIVGGDTDNFSGATLQLFGQTQASYAGKFYLRASTRSDVSDTSHPVVDLVGSPDGSLTWGDKEIERVNSKGSKYIRYENGIQICWGNGSQSSGIISVTFPLPFIDNYYDCFGCALPGAAGSGAGRIVTCSSNKKTPTSIALTVLNIDGSLAGTGVDWFAIGYWK